jgi:putative sigma-54 modulation protein
VIAASTIERISMQIEVKGRNTPVNDELREYVEKRFRKVAKQVSDLARLEIELKEERNPAIADNMVAEATLVLKGVTLRARDNARDLRHAINLCEEELSRQVKRHREKRRGRRKVGADTIRTGGPEELEGGTQAAF